MLSLLQAFHAWFHMVSYLNLYDNSSIMLTSCGCLQSILQLHNPPINISCFKGWLHNNAQPLILTGCTHETDQGNAVLQGSLPAHCCS